MLYHHVKANVVGYTLSQMSMNNIAYIEDERKELVKDIHRLAHLDVSFSDSNNGGVLDNKGLMSLLVEDVKEKQDIDSNLFELKMLVSKK